MPQDTTNPAAHAKAVAIFTPSANDRAFEAAERVRFKILGMHYADVGPEWSSQGRLETDYVHHLAFALSGSAFVIHEGKTMELRPGFAYWLHGNTPVRRKCPRRFELYYLRFRCEWHEGVDALLDWPGRRPIFLGRWDTRQLPQEWRRPSLSTNAILRLRGMLGLWLAEHFEGLDEFITHHRKAHARFGKVLRHIEEQCDASVRVEDLARLHGSSLSAFSRMFTRSMRISPKLYMNRKLNETACRMLLDSDQSLAGVAASLRFSDEYDFNRFFTRMNGIPPGIYRRRFR